MASSPAEKSMANWVALAEEQLAQKKNSDALLSLRKALRLCGCYRRQNSTAPRPLHKLDTSCLLGSIQLALDSNDPDAVYDAAQRDCLCGAGKDWCRQNLHLQIIDKIAACRSGDGLYASAARIAAMVIHLAPESPMGYCRLTQVYRLSKPRNQSSRDPDYTEYAASLVRHGIRNVQKHGDVNDPLYKVLQVIQSKIIRVDPFTNLPHEIKAMICSYLNTGELCTCMRVSKGWLKAIGEDQSLWTQVHFGPVKRAPSRKQLARLIRRAPLATSLFIQDSDRFRLNLEKLQVIFWGLRKLRHICFGNITKGCLEIHDQIQITYPGSPKSLSLQYADVQGSFFLQGPISGSNGPIEDEMLSKFSATLEELKLSNYSDIPSCGHGFLALKCLYLDGFKSTDHNISTIEPREMDALIAGTPNLEQFYIANYTFEPFWSSSPTQDLSSNRWTKLKVFTAGPNTQLNSLGQVSLNLSFAAADLRVFEVLTEDEKFDFPGQRDPTDIFPDWGRLETFRSVQPLISGLLPRLVGPSLKNGKLKTLEISPAFDESGEIMELLELNEDMPFSSEHVHTLCLTGFFIPGDLVWSHRGTGAAQPLLNLLARFPNVRTIGAYPRPFHGHTDVIKILLGLDGIKTIYQDCLMGVELDEALEVARKRGIQLVHSKTFLSAPFPRLLTDESS